MKFYQNFAEFSVRHVAKDTFLRTIDVNCPLKEVFEKFQDVQLVSGFLPILSELREIEPLKSYEAVLEDRVGPFKLRSDLSIKTNVDPDLFRFSVEARGEDRQVRSAIRVSAEIRFEFISEKQTMLTLEGSYEVIGKVATLGASVIKSKASKLIVEFENQVRKNFEA